MRAPLLLLGGIVVLSLAVARALSCVCSPLECDVLTDEDCPGGLTWDPCRCCKVCARVEGEPCGGLFGFSGRCADGLQCVIKNLLHHAGELDEGVCAKIPGRWRRDCPRGPVMSGPGCNLVGEADGNAEGNGAGNAAGNAAGSGKCVCGPSVPWCPDEPPPYVYVTRHECKLNLAAKIAYDDLFNSGDTASGEDGGRAYGDACPEDSALTEDGDCECLGCPAASCRPGQRTFVVRPAVPEVPGSCCPLYECRAPEPVSWAKALTEDGKTTTYCIHGGDAKELGERWRDSPCVTCVCGQDGVSCQEPMCKSCENAIPPDPGECCPHCPDPTANATLLAPCRKALDGCDLRCDHGYVNDENNCPTCSCTERKSDNGTSAPASAPPSTEDEKICPELPHCGLNCDLVKDEGGCSVCACQTPLAPPNVTSNRTDEATSDPTDRKVCPEVRCDLHCERGYVMDENDCTFCECRAPNADCQPLVGCRKRCAFGYKNNKRGCPICRCRASCTDHLNETHPEGASWYPNSCTTCTCETGGKLSCKETICSVACSNPLPPKSGTCCPMCPITPAKENETGHLGTRGWGTVPIMLIVILAVLCLLLIVHIVRSRFRGRLSPSEVSYSSYPPHYKCVPAYDTPVHRNEKIVPL